MFDILRNLNLVLSGCALFFATVGVAQCLMATQVLSPTALRRMGVAHLMLALAFGARIFWNAEEFSYCLIWSQLGYTLHAFLFLSAFSQYRTGSELPRWAWIGAPLAQMPALIGVFWPPGGILGIAMAYILIGLVHLAGWHFCRPDSDPIKTRIFWMFRLQEMLAVVSFVAWGVWLLIQPSGRDIPMDRWLTAVHFLLTFWLCLITAMAFGYLLMRDMGNDIERRSNTDPLTGAHNRLGLQKHMRNRERRHHDHTNGLTVIAIDLDHFKAVNDTWGHAAGDSVLSQCAARLKAQLRGENLLVRMGGEEFLALLDGVQATLLRSKRAMLFMCGSKK